MGRMRLAPEFNPAKQKPGRDSQTCARKRRRLGRPGPVLFKKLGLSHQKQRQQDTNRLTPQRLTATARKKLTNAEIKDGLLRSVLVANISGVNQSHLRQGHHVGHARQRGSPSPTNQLDDGEVDEDSLFDRFECRSFPGSNHSQSLWQTPPRSPLAVCVWSPKPLSKKKLRTPSHSARVAAAKLGAWDPTTTSSVTTPPPTTPHATHRMPLAPTCDQRVSNAPARSLWNQNQANAAIST